MATSNLRGLLRLPGETEHIRNAKGSLQVICNLLDHLSDTRGLVLGVKIYQIELMEIKMKALELYCQLQNS